ncbi:MAG: hypothetical protein KJ927_09330, partial [Candidatus Eisenbacteria bacterium]|nr:hypothetical protein [Candidatus Eisenbacteria bacterium]
IYLVVTGSLGDYYLTTVKLNLSQPQPFAGHANLTRSFYQNTMFWILGGGGALILLIRPRLPFNLKVVSFAGIVLVLTAFIAKQPHRQYFMGALPLLSISGGYVLTELTDRMRSPKILRAVILMCLIAMPLIYLTFVKQRTNGKQLAAIQYVLENSASNDCVYDGDIQFNLYRRDLHYFWYSVSKNKGLDNFNKITNGRYQDYNICALILSKKPKIISRFNLNINECDLMSYYTQTEFKNIYIRRDGNAAF